MGLAVGDALGVPVEGSGREGLKGSPVTGMRGYGVHHQPPGTWSDDTSLTLCLVDSLCAGYDLDDIGQRFCRWLYDGYWTPWGYPFGIGGTTAKAISRLAGGIEPRLAGLRDEYSNGNGSLMRILPVALYFAPAGDEALLEAAHEVSSITHAHPRSQMACGIYTLVASHLLAGDDPHLAYSQAVQKAARYYLTPPFDEELEHFRRVLGGRLGELDESRIGSGGYVVETLEAAIWCLLTRESYRDTVLAAVSLGGDTDTTAAVAGGLAGIWYGLDGIPGEWISGLARVDDVKRLLNRFHAVVVRRWEAGGKD